MTWAFPIALYFKSKLLLDYMCIIGGLSGLVIFGAFVIMQHVGVGLLSVMLFFVLYVADIVEDWLNNSYDSKALKILEENYSVNLADVYKHAPNWYKIRFTLIEATPTQLSYLKELGDSAKRYYSTDDGKVELQKLTNYLAIANDTDSFNAENFPKEFQEYEGYLATFLEYFNIVEFSEQKEELKEIEEVKCRLNNTI